MTAFPCRLRPRRLPISTWEYSLLEFETRLVPPGGKWPSFFRESVSTLRMLTHTIVQRIQCDSARPHCPHPPLRPRHPRPRPASRRRSSPRTMVSSSLGPSIPQRRREKAAVPRYWLEHESGLQLDDQRKPPTRACVRAYSRARQARCRILAGPTTSAPYPPATHTTPALSAMLEPRQSTTIPQESP